MTFEWLFVNNHIKKQPQDKDQNVRAGYDDPDVFFVLLRVMMNALNKQEPIDNFKNI